MAVKRVIAVITFDDEEDSITDLASASLEVEVACGQRLKVLEVTAYSTAADAAADEADKAGDFAIPARIVGL